MCCSLDEAHFTGTKILGHRMDLPQVGNIQVILYQNKVLSQGGAPNAMLLHVPTNTAMGPENFIDMTDASDVLEDMVRALQPPVSRGGDFMIGSASLGCDSVQVFDSGQYTIVLADNAEDIHGALSRVPEDKRPEIKKSLLQFCQETYPVGYKFFLACFNNRSLREPAPIGYWYVPTTEHSDYFMIPAVDSHTGEAPDLFASVHVDHYVFLSTDKMTDGVRVHYSDDISNDVARFLPTRIVGREYYGSLPNGDFRFPVDLVNKGHMPKGERVAPGVTA